ncbi:MAG: FAD:protein FMN transferase [Spirochaetales bacterium]|nr:FAD:protein FMN transferase [Spirochaetales bacterium]
MYRKNGLTALVVLCVVCLLLSSCRNGELVRTDRFVLGTVCFVSLPSGTDDAGIWQTLQQLDRTLSAHDPDSELGYLNANAGAGWVTVSEELYDAIVFSIKMAEITRGAFNPAIGALTALWDIEGENPAVPTADSISEALEHIDWRQIETGEGNTVRINDLGLRLDLGGMGKGLAADIVAGLLRENGIKSALLNFGGNIMCVGSRPDGKDFQIGIQIPFAQRNSYRQVVQASDLSVVTSGKYEKYFTDETGKQWHHIIDPQTGYPVETPLASVTVTGPSSAVCDALSTALFVLGEADADRILQGFTGYGALFIYPDGSCNSYGN